MKPILLKAHERSLTFLKNNRDGDLLFSCSKDHNPNVWFADNGERLGNYKGHNGAVWSCDVSCSSWLKLGCYHLSGRGCLGLISPEYRYPIGFGEANAEVVCQVKHDSKRLRRRWVTGKRRPTQTSSLSSFPNGHAQSGESDEGDWTGEQVAAAISLALQTELPSLLGNLEKVNLGGAIAAGNDYVDSNNRGNGGGGGGAMELSMVGDVASGHERHMEQAYSGYGDEPTCTGISQKSFDEVKDNTMPSLSSSAVPFPTSKSVQAGEVLSPAAKELVYQVLEVVPGGGLFKKDVTRRQLLKSSGLRPRDLRRIDPSLWVTNALPALLVRDHAILINLGSLRAIVTPENVLVFDESSIGARGFLEVLQQRLHAANSSGPNGALPGLAMPFELEVLESALISRVQRLENALNQVEPRVASLLRILPVKVTADALEELRISKQALVELGSKAGALRQMLLEFLETPVDIRRVSAMGHHCSVRHGVLQCRSGVDAEAAEEEEEEVEMLFEYYLQRVDLCHGQAEKLLESAKEMEDSIAVNLSSRRLEVSRFELMLAIATFAAAIGAVIAGIFGMNLRSYLEENVSAFWITAGGIVVGAVILFFALLAYLRKRRIL